MWVGHETWDVTKSLAFFKSDKMGCRWVGQKKGTKHKAF